MKNIHAKMTVALTLMAFTTFSVAGSFGESADKRVEVTSLQLEHSTPYGTIAGTAVNHSATLVKTVFVNFNLYDRNDTLVGNAGTYVKNLEAGKTWSFSASAPKPFNKAKVAEVIVYDN